MVQTVMLRMHSRQSETPIDNVGGYIFTVAANVLREAATSPVSRAIHVEIEDDAHVEAITPERVVIGRQEISALVIALQGLPDRTRQIFVAHRFEDRTYANIAQEHGISVSAIEKHISSALRTLSRALGYQP